jgi:hypothetical protein
MARPFARSKKLHGDNFTFNWANNSNAQNKPWTITYLPDRKHYMMRIKQKEIPSSFTSIVFAFLISCE